MTTDGWEKLPLRDLADVTGGGTPRRAEPSYWNGGIPWATPTDVTGLRGRTISETSSTITRAGLKESSAALLPPKSLLLTTRATIGACAITAVPMATNQGFQNLVPQHGTCVEFLYYSIQHSRRRLERLAAGSTFREVSKASLRTLRFVVPPFREQRKIAAILSSVDEAIEKTQAVVEQVQSVRQGQVQQLLTLGLPGRHTAFKPTVVGDVPSVWEVKTVGAVAASGKNSCIGGPFGSDLTRKDYVDSPGVPVIRGSNLAGTSVWLDESHFVFVSARKASDLQRNMAFPGDVIVTQRGTLGQVCMIPNQSRFPQYLLSQSQMKVSVDKRQISAEFLLAYLRSSRALRLIEAMTIGTGVPHLNLGILKAFPVPVPEVEEQELIVRHLTAADTRIDAELRSSSALKILKSALMSVLLTGELRVTPDPEPEPE